MKKLLLPFLFLLPGVASAQVTDFKSLVNLLIDLLRSVLTLLFVLAFAAFFWGVFLFISNVNDDQKRSQGKQWMLWSVIALFVMVTLWGIIELLVDTVGVNTFVIPQLPSS